MMRVAYLSWLCYICYSESQLYLYGYDAGIEA